MFGFGKRSQDQNSQPLFSSIVISDRTNEMMPPSAWNVITADYSREQSIRLISDNSIEFTCITREKSNNEEFTSVRKQIASTELSGEAILCSLYGEVSAILYYKQPRAETCYIRGNKVNDPNARGFEVYFQSTDQAAEFLQKFSKSIRPLRIERKDFSL
jgi:hypothetical protein